jgi:LCP family protein required for cell wall assembly
LTTAKKSKKSLWKFLLPIFFLIVAVIAVVYFSHGTRAIFDPISIVANVSAADLKETDGRTNVLIIGLDRRNDGVLFSLNTDTLIVASIGRVDGDIVLISIPRDLWVESPTGGFNKINAMYAYGGGDNGGAQNLQKVVENVLGLPIHYYAVVDFNIFKETINTLGGIDVNVENAFTDHEYPIDGKEVDMCGKSQEEADKQIEAGQALYVIFPCRYETLNFQAGPQKMDAETALKYARSRHATTTIENTDFARAKRQQNVITAVKNKALSMNTLFNPIKLKELYDTYAKNVQTSIDLPTMQSFYLLSQQVNFNNVKSIVLDDRSSAEVGGLLYAPTDTTLYGGKWVLIPRAGDFSQLHAYVQKYIFGTK